MRITSAGLIQLTGSTALLQLLGGGTSTQYQKWANDGGNYFIGISNSTGGGLLTSQNAYSFCLVTESARDMAFGTNNTERMRITSGGFTKISNDGTYVGAASSYHEIKTTQSNQNIIYFSNTSASPYGPYITFTGAVPNNGTNYFLSCVDTSATRVELRSNGGIANYSANDVNLSDIRTKKDIIPLGSYWDKFKAIEIVKFKYKDQTHDDYNIGVISQQVESVAPEFVDVDGWGETPEDGIPLKSIYTADLYHATIKVLQEAMVKIENQQSQIEELKTLLKA